MSDVEIPESLPSWIQDHLRRYLESNGEDGHLWKAPGMDGPPVPTLLLTTTGQSSGQARILPLIYGEADDAFVIVASKGGAPAHPSWYTNLVAQSDVGVQVGPRRFRATARTAAGAEREALWKHMLTVWPAYAQYQDRTEREIPVVVLDPRDG